MRHRRRFIQPNQNKCTKTVMIPEEDQRQAMQIVAQGKYIVDYPTYDLKEKLAKVVEHLATIGEMEKAVKVSNLRDKSIYGSVQSGKVYYYPQGEKKPCAKIYPKLRTFTMYENKEDADLCETVIKWWSQKIG